MRDSTGRRVSDPACDRQNSTCHVSLCPHLMARTGSDQNKSGGERHQHKKHKCWLLKERAKQEKAKHLPDGGKVPSNPTPDLPDTMASAGAGRMLAPTSQRTDCSELQSSELQFPPVYHLVFYTCTLLLIFIRHLMFAPIRENATSLPTYL